MSEKVKRKYRARIKDVNAPRRPTTAFNFFMKTNSHNYLEQHKDLQLNEVIKIMSVDWHKLTPDERRPFDEAAAAAREEYEKELARYQKTDAYSNYQKLKSDYKHGLIKPEDIKKATKNSPKKEIGGPALKSISKKKLKFGFEVFSETFKEFNRKREDELRKLRKTVNRLEEEIEDAEERIENLQKSKIKLISEKQESQIIQKRCKETSDRYLKVLLENMSERMMEQYGFKKDLTIRQAGKIITEIRQKPALSQQFKKYIETLKFN